MKDILCRAFCEALDVRSVPSGYAVTTPYRFDDGDPIVVYAMTVSAGVYRLEDSGVQMPTLLGSGVAISDGFRREAFDGMLNEYDLVFDPETMVVKSQPFAESEIGMAMLKMVAFLLRLQDFLLLTPERVKRTWQDDALKSIHLTFDPIGKVEEYSAALPEARSIPADAVVHFNNGGTPLAIFLATSDSKGLQALILKMELEKYQNKKCTVVLLLERAKQNPLREATYAMAQARLDDVLTYRGAEPETMSKLSTYQNEAIGLQ